jgi:hypothetical protein
MANLCGIEIVRVTITSRQDVVGVTSLARNAPETARAIEDRRLLQRHTLILVAGKASEERASPGITSVFLKPMHLFDYEGKNKAKDLISRWTALTGGSVGADLEQWEHRAESVFADDCIWGAVCRIASMLDAAKMIDGEKALSGAEVNDILAQLIQTEKREAFSREAFG